MRTTMVLLRLSMPSVHCGPSPHLNRGLQTLSLYAAREEKQEQSLVAIGEETAFIRPTDVVGGKKWAERFGKTGQYVWNVL